MAQSSSKRRGGGNYGHLPRWRARWVGVDSPTGRVWEGQVMGRANPGVKTMHEAAAMGPVTLEGVLAKENLNTAWQQVSANDGAAGVDGRSVAQSQTHIRSEWPGIERALLSGRYRPEAVRAVTIINARVKLTQ